MLGDDYIVSSKVFDQDKNQMLWDNMEGHLT